MDVTLNFDLLTVGVAVAILFLIGVAVIFANPRSSSSRYFALFCFVNGLWGIANYASYQLQNPTLILFSLRLILLLAVFQGMGFYAFIESFGDTKLPKWFKYIGAPIGSVVAFLALTPLYFTGISAGNVNIAPQPIVSPLIGIFALTAIFFVIMSIYSLIKQLLHSSGVIKEQLSDILTGTALMFSLIICLNFLAPVLFHTTYFVPLGALFVLPFAILTAYAILRFHLFNIKAVATGILTFLLVMTIFVEVIFTDSLLLRLWKIVEASLVLVFGIMLFRGVVREVRQREHIEMLAKELEETNERQEGLIHFIGHEVKGFLARYMGAFSGLVDGDYGQIPDTAKDITGALLTQSRKDSRMVMDLLQASNLKKGTVSFQMEPFDAKEAVNSIIEKLKPSAEAKGLALNVSIPEGTYMLTGDKEKLGDHVFQNLIENSINYTPTGSITVSLQKEDNKIVFEVRDTGIGLSDDDKTRLFTEGGHGKEASKINVHSTGYGLFIAKSTVIAHQGTIRAESEGSGKGSQFIVELPINASTISTPTQK